MNEFLANSIQIKSNVSMACPFRHRQTSGEFLGFVYQKNMSNKPPKNPKFQQLSLSNDESLQMRDF